MRKNKDTIKKSTKKAIPNLKGNSYLQTNDVEQVNYNSGIEPHDLGTVNYKAMLRLMMYLTLKQLTITSQINTG